MSLSRSLRSLGALSARWLEPRYDYRRKAVRVLTSGSGFSERMADEMLDALFSELTAPKLGRLLKNEIGNPAAMERFVRDGPNRRRVRAYGPGTALHVFASNVPAAAVTSLVLGLLVADRNVCKVSRRDEGILGLYLDSLKAHDRRLWKKCVLIRGRGQAAAWAKKADLVAAYGSDESLAEIRKHVPAKTRFVGYGNRVSFAILTKEVLGRSSSRTLAAKTALDVWMADRRGCLSPVAVFVQRGGQVSAKDFASGLSDGLLKLERAESKGPRRSTTDWASMMRLRQEMGVRSLAGASTAFWQSAKGGWAVAYDERLEAEYSDGGQIIRVKAFDRLKQLEPVFRALKGSLQAVSLECSAQARGKTGEWLAKFGVNRICRAGQLQKPPITWHHDGGLNLANWLYWTDLED